MTGERSAELRAVAPPRSRIGAIAVALAAAASATALAVWAVPDPAPPAERGFQLDQGAPPPMADPTDLPPLDHPVPDNLEADLGAPGGIPAAMAGQRWFVEGFQTAQAWSFEQDTIWRPTSIFPILDMAGDGLTIADGIRSTWSPPPCDCPTIRVWVYGGSTTYGLNQRDEHTIPSELARAAWRDGVRLEVENRGVLGYLHWLEAERFAYDLTVDEAPDVVVFYDGVNETWAGNVLETRRSGDVRMVMDPTNVDVWGYTARSREDPPPAPTSARLIGWDRGTLLGLRQLAQVTMARYDRSREITRGLAELHGVEAFYVWQPSRVSRDLILAEPHGTTDQERYTRMRDQLQREYLADDVIDVVDVFDASSEPIFTDDVHHNELGAKMVAEAIYANIGDELRAIAEEEGGGR